MDKTADGAKSGEELARRYVTKLKRCLLAVKIIMICAVAAIAALTVFVAVAKFTGLTASNINATLLTVVIVGSVAVACVISSLVILFVSRRLLKKLKALGEAEN